MTAPAQFGPWVERLEAIAVGRELVAVAGRRDAAGVTASRVHVVPAGLLDGRGAAWSLDAGAAIAALGFAGDELLVGGGDDGRLIAWDVTGQRRAAELELGAPIRALALDAGAARGDAGSIAVGTADGALHVVALAVRDAAPVLGPVTRRALSDGAIAAVAWDPAGLWVAGGADGQLWVIGEGHRAVAPGGDGGIRAVVCLGDGRAAIGCGDGSIRLCFVVGDVEPSDRSGDHGHQAAVRGLVLAPVVTDAAGREQPRRLISAGEDGAVKLWLVDGNRRPRTIELGIGPLTGLGLAPAPGAAVAGAVAPLGRLWAASARRAVAALVLGGDAEPLGEPAAIGSVLDGLEAQLRDPRAAVKVKIDAVAALSGIAEDEARGLLDLALGSALGGALGGAPGGGPVEVRVAATQAMARSDRRASRPALRAALGAEQPELRGAAFHALRELERDQPLAAVRAGLAARFEDVRVRAVEALIAPARSSVIAAGMIAEALRDAHPVVRRRAFAALREVARDPADAVRTALARGTPDVRAEALLHLGFALRLTEPEARGLTAGAFDDADPQVRRAAFLAAVMQRPALAARLAALPGEGGVAADLAQVARDLGIALALPADPGGVLGDDELEPLFAQLACRSADAAIRGAGCLLALGDPRAVGAVLQLTREADPALRRGATANLVAALAIWPDEDRLATRLVWLLDDADPEVRAFAFDALARGAAAAGPAGELELAETALRTSQEDIRVRALQILVRVGAPGTAATGAAPRAAGAVDRPAERLLGDALDDEAAVVRSEAFRTLWAWHAGEPLLPLTRGAQSRHGDIRGQVVAEIERRRRADQSSPEIDRLLLGLVGDAVAAVGLAAYTALTRQPDDAAAPIAVPVDVHLAAMRSPAPAVRTAGARGAARPPLPTPRDRVVQLVVQLIKDDHPPVHTAAIEALDELAPDHAEGFALAFASVFYELQVRAGELCGRRRDGRAIAPMQRVLSIPNTDPDRPGDAIRQRAARALADVGDPATTAFQLGLIDDDDPIVREMAARGLATAAQPGHTASRIALVGLLGHADLPVRSWAGEGLAKLGDLRALPVLAGTQRHDHRPLRFGAIAGFAALGPDGVRGLRQGLEDREREICDLAFAVIVARDAALAAAGIAPDLLVDAMSSPSPEIRFAAARLVERRAAGQPVDADVIGELVGPRRPDKAGDMKDWPPAPRRAALLQVVADAVASDEPGVRYAATQVLALRGQPLTFWREAARLAGPGRAPPAPHTSGSSEARVARRTGWLRRLVGARRDPEASELELLAALFARAGRAGGGDLAAAQRLVFGVYAGLVRQAPVRGAADETHRVRRDAIARLAELARDEAVGADAVLPVLGHALGDPHHLVRQAAMAALRSLYPVGALAPLQMAIAGAADLGRAAIDELVALAGEGDDRARGLIRGALDADDADVRAHAALRLARLYPAGSAAPQLLAAQSRHADVRLGAIAQLASALEAAGPAPGPGPGGAAAADPTAAIVEALVGALGSEHADLRLRAAVALAGRGDPLGIDVLGAFLRSDDHADQALTALVGLAGRAPAAGGAGASDAAGAAAEVIAARLESLDRSAEPDGASDPEPLIEALGAIGHPLGAAPLVRLVVAVPAGKDAEVAPLVGPAIDAVLAILRDRGARPRALPDGRTRQRLRDELAVVHLGDLARSPLAQVRLRAAAALGDVDARGAEDSLARLLADRDPEVRVAAAEALALRAEYVPGATLAALESALRGGRRELVLPAALGLAARKRPEAFQPLLLVARAGEPGERERALVALGALGDRRALDQLLPLLDPEPDDEAGRALTPAAAEALGRLLPALAGDEAADLRARLERLAMSAAGDVRLRALTGLRYAGELAVVLRVAADREARSDVRSHAIDQLGLSGAAATETALAELLSDDDREVRDEAVAALSRVLGGDRTRVSLHALGARHDDISRPAATYLATAGDPATLVARLGAVHDPEVRRMLREGLIRRAALPRPELQAALDSPDPIPRAEAAWIAGSAGDAARPLAAAIEAAVGRSAAQRPAARGGALGPAQLVEIDALWAGLWAARRVGAAGAVAVEATAHALLADDRASPALRREAAAVLAAASSGPALTALTGATGDADREVRAVAAGALGARAPQVAAQAVRGLGSRADATTIAPLALAAWPALAGELIAEPATRAWSLAVSLIGARVDDLIAIATTRGSAARLAAIAGLGRLGGERAIQTLEAIHADRSEDDAIRLAAWKALRRIRRRGARTYAEGQDKGPSGGGAAGASSGDDADADADSVDDDDDSDDDSAADSDDDDSDGGDDDVDDDDDDDDDDGGDEEEEEDEDD
ncbi:MAG TPA: HEAT repeat domain-containing protein [Kofleriaceae bacterium]|nr:HEAT repeat domain-containing protein [Kofleriaceae bacterium]